MKIRNLTEKQYQYLKKLCYYTNYKKCTNLKALTIIQASYLIKKLEKEWRKILVINQIKHKITNANFDKCFWEEILKKYDKDELAFYGNSIDKYVKSKL